jgi:hypothetical protein
MKAQSELELDRANRGLGRSHMRCPLCGREMKTLPGVRRGRISEIMYYCEEHGLLGRPSASILLSQIQGSEPESQTPEPKSD